MAFTNCPKCGYQGAFEDECPACGVYASKFLAMQQRRASQGLPPFAGGGVSSPGLPAIPEPGRESPDPERTRRIAIWAVVLAVLAAVGYVVLSDWLGAAYSYTPPPGWVPMDRDSFKQAADAASSHDSFDMELHGAYVPQGTRAGAETAMILVSQANESIVINEASVARVRGGFAMMQAAPQLRNRIEGKVELRKYGSLDAIEMEIHITVPGLESSQVQVIFGADPGGFGLSFVGPSEVVRADLEAFRASVSSFRILAPQGLRGAGWFKHGLRWSWVLAVVWLVYIVQGQIRSRA